MGLISPLLFSQLAAAYQRPQFMGPVTQTQQPPPPRAAPFRPVQPVTAAPIANPQAMQAPQPYTAPQVRPPGFGERLNDWTQSPLFNLGMSLLGNASSPDQWAGVGRDVRTFGADQRQRQQQENEERRLAAAERMQGQQFGWQTEDRARQQGQRQSLEQWVASLPAEQQAAARANPEAAHAAYMEAQAAANQPITPFQQQQLALQQRGLGIDAMNAQANMARANVERPLRGPDAALMTSVRDAADRTSALVQLGGVFMQQNGPGGTGTGPETRYNPFYGWQTGAQNMNAVVSQMIPFMRAPGSGATSDYEQQLYQRGVQSTSNTPDANAAIYRNQQSLAEMAQARRYFFEDWLASGHSSLNGAEQAFRQSSQFQDIVRRNPVDRPQQQQGRAPAAQGGITPEQARAELERREIERRRQRTGNQPGGYTGR